MNKQYDIVDVSNSFNKTIKKILLIITNSINENILFETVKRRTILIIKSHPIFLLEEGGPELFKYRDYIKDNLEDLFNHLEDEIFDNQQMQEYIKDNENEKRDIITLLKIIKTVWSKYSKDEKKILHNMLKTLLSDYCKFLTIKI
jgi:hypothetical protein